MSNNLPPSLNAPHQSFHPEVGQPSYKESSPPHARDSGSSDNATPVVRSPLTSKQGDVSSPNSTQHESLINRYQEFSPQRNDLDGRVQSKVDGDNVDQSVSNSDVNIKPTSEIEFAITLDNVPRLQRALEKEHKSKKKTSYESIFEQAVKRSKVQICKFCLRQDPSIDMNKSYPSFPKSTALMQSIKTRTTTDQELYKLLLEHGADPNKGDEYFLPIQKAITNQDDELIDALVAAGVSLEEEDNAHPDRGTPLWFALHMNCFQSFLHLIKLGANVNARRKGRTLLHYISEHREIKQGVQIVRILLDNHADIEAKDSRGMTPFLHAADYGRVDIMTVLKECGAHVKAIDRSEKNALEICVESAHAIHHLDAVEYVLGLGLDDSNAVKSLQNLVDKIGSKMYIDLANLFKKYGKPIKIPGEDSKDHSSTEEGKVNIQIENGETKHVDSEVRKNSSSTEDSNLVVHSTPDQKDHSDQKMGAYDIGSEEDINGFDGSTILTGHEMEGEAEGEVDGYVDGEVDGEYDYDEEE